LLVRHRYTFAADAGNGLTEAVDLEAHMVDLVPLAEGAVPLVEHLDVGAAPGVEIEADAFATAGEAERDRQVEDAGPERFRCFEIVSEYAHMRQLPYHACAHAWLLSRFAPGEGRARRRHVA